MRISKFLPICYLCLLMMQVFASPAIGEKLKVGVSGSAPFVQRDGGKIDGISVRIWEALAEVEDADFEFVEFPAVDKALKALERGEVDVAVGPISITSERAARVSFTQPYFSSGLGILSHTKQVALADRLRPFLSKAFFYGLVFLLTLLSIVGSLVWLCERGMNSEQFPRGPSGLANGMWFAIVTMTTVGYGDKCPTTPSGRILAAVWMMITTLTFSTLTAGIATALTLSSLNAAEITSPGALRNRRVAVVSGTTSADAARHFGATGLNCKNLEQAIERLTEGSVDAVVFDHPALNHFIQTNPQDQLRLAHSTFESQNYGFALPLRSNRLHRYNVALLKLSEIGELQAIEEHWLANAQ